MYVGKWMKVFCKEGIKEKVYKKNFRFLKLEYDFEIWKFWEKDIFRWKKYK